MEKEKTASMMSYVIAVDFDGCLCEDRWPGIGATNWPAVKRLMRERQRGSRLILWTCRTGELLEAAVNWCAERGLTFDAVNENLPERIQQYGGDCRKISADAYWDDRAVRIAFSERCAEGSA